MRNIVFKGEYIAISSRN